jgi:diguanylate cyclase (GGDEF)-like protein
MKKLTLKSGRHKIDLQVLKESEARLRSIVLWSVDAIIVTDTKGKIEYMNPAAEKVFNRKVEDFIGKDFGMPLVDGKSTEIDIFRPGKDPGIGDMHVVKTKWLNKKAHLIMIRDITERKQAVEALKESENRYRELCIIDDLTQLYNSRHFYHQLEAEIDRANRYEQPLAILILDVDDFKRFNDAYGHIEGDRVLHRLGQVIKRCLRQTDSAYRYGGEEFVALLPMTTDENAAISAERIRTEFRKEIFTPLPGQSVHVTVSIGLGQYRKGESMRAFVHRIDQLMYKGKKSGKDKVCSELWNREPFRG